MTALTAPARIDGERVYLRLLTEMNASDKYAGWLSDPTVNEYLETRSASIEDLKQYIREKNSSDTAQLFGIFLQKTDEHLGNVKLEPIDLVSKTATMGILIGEKTWWGKGIATEVTNVIVSYAFYTLQLDEVNLGVIANNLAARRVYEKCGFEVVRIDKDGIDHDGKKFDQVWMRKKRN